MLCWILRQENLISQDPYPFRSLNGYNQIFEQTDVFRKGRRKELHLFRGDINPLSFLVIYAVELGMNSHFRGGTGFVRPNLFFDEPFCLGTYRMV